MIFHLPGRMCTYLLAISVLEKFGLDPKTMPLKPMSVEQCVSEGLRYLLKNRPMIVPGRLRLSGLRSQFRALLTSGWAEFFGSPKILNSSPLVNSPTQPRI
jgi:hypothetical protein